MSVLAGSNGFEGRLFVNGVTSPREAEGMVCARYFRCKNALGLVAALLLLVPCLPVIGALVLLVRLTSPGPGIYRQTRVGKDGRTFTMYKIRTMRIDAESASGPTWATKNDPRLTRVGRVIRAMHLDEFPQLLNVLRGEMALIGPRPERPEFTTILARDIPDYLKRLAVRPGITGLAQINLPPDTDLDSVRRKLVLDLEYIRSANSLLDLRIMIWTLFRAGGARGYHLSRVLGLHRVVDLPAVAEPTPIRLAGHPVTNGAAALADPAFRIPVARRSTPSGGVISAQAPSP